MKAIISRLSLLLAVALAASAVVAASAQAQAVWSPNDTTVFGIAEDTRITYGGSTIGCDTSTVAGRTGVDSPVLNVELSFPDGCNVSGLGATMMCSTMDPDTGDGGMGLIAIDPVNNTGTVDLNDGFFCNVVVPGICTVGIAGPQSGVGVFVLDEAAGILTIDIDDAAATRTGSSLCGPASGTAVFGEDYDMSPSGLAIIPTP